MAPLSLLPRLSGFGLLRQARLPLSTKASNNVPDAGVMEPVRQVFISQSSDVFSNLALEDWLYRHHDFEHKRLLLLRMFELIIATLQGLRLQHLQTLPSPHHADLPPHLLQVVHGAVVAPIGILQHLQESSPGLKQLRIKWKDLVAP